jgi:hypothetical protein
MRFFPARDPHGLVVARHAIRPETQKNWQVWGKMARLE